MWANYLQEGYILGYKTHCWICEFLGHLKSVNLFPAKMNHP